MKREGTDGVSFCPGRHEKVVLEGQGISKASDYLLEIFNKGEKVTQ